MKRAAGWRLILYHRWMKGALAALVLFGCGTATAPVATNPPGPVRQAEIPLVPDAGAPSPVELQLVEGAASTLPDGTTVNVKHVMYAHLADSKNLSSCTIVVSRGGQTVDVALANEHGDPSAAPMVKDALGWQFTLQMADPYHQPSRAIVAAKRP
jgi:hypothetical protein